MRIKPGFPCRYKVLVSVVCLVIVTGAVWPYVAPRVVYRTNLSPDGSLTIVRRLPAADYRFKKLPAYDPSSQDPFQIDLRGGDVSREDLTGRFTDLMHANFDRPHDLAWELAHRL